MAGDITLSAAVRRNLLTLQSTADMMSGVQNKLATGKKVNSALDNPNSFFTASGLDNRARDLGTLLDDMGQSVQTIKAADKGLAAITKLVEGAKAKANQALQTQSQHQRAKLAEQYNDLLEQISGVAKDSSYKGKNLLAGDGNDLTTIFNEDSTSKMTINAVDYTDPALSSGLNLSDLDEAQGTVGTIRLRGGRDDITLTDSDGNALKLNSLLTDSTTFQLGDDIKVQDATSGTVGTLVETSLIVGSDTTVADLVASIEDSWGASAEFDEDTGDLTLVSNETRYLVRDRAGDADLATATSSILDASTDLLTDSGSFVAGDVITVTDGNDYELGSFEVDDDSTVDDFNDFLDSLEGVSSSFDASSGQMLVQTDMSLNIDSDNDDFNTDYDNFAISRGLFVTADQESGFSSDGKIERVVDKLNTALSTLRAQASEFGTNLSTIETRQTHTNQMINTLQEGAGLLTLADTNAEGANLLALQTRQQLASTSLSFASQADQTVLSLF